MRRSLECWGRLAVVTLGLALAQPTRALETNCSDGLDDDGDFATDCADTDCALDAACEVGVSRDLSVVRDSPADPRTAWLNVYLVSWPEMADIGDRADLAFAGTEKCVGFVGGPTVGDGVVNSADATCLLWTGSAGRGDSLMFSRYDRDTCVFVSQIISRNAFGTALGGVTFPLDLVEGYWVSVGSTGVPPPVGRVRLEGWHDRAWPGHDIRAPVPGCHPSLDVLHLPYDMMYATADEILCGLAGVDFALDANGDPITCPNGIFDGSTPISVETIDNFPGATPTGLLATDDAPVARSVLMTDLGLQFLGPRFTVGPGDAVLVQIRDEQSTTLFLPPRY